MRILEKIVLDLNQTPKEAATCPSRCGASDAPAPSSPPQLTPSRERHHGIAALLSPPRASSHHPNPRSPPPPLQLNPLALWRG